MKEPVGKGQAGVGFTVVYETDPGLPPDLRIGIRTDYESGDYVTHYIAPADARAMAHTLIEFADKCAQALN